MPVPIEYSVHAVTERHITPTKITAWLDCAHFLSLSNQVDDGLLDPVSSGSNAFTQMLARKGAEHEQACLEDYERQGLSIYRVEHRLPTESFTEWVARIGNPLDGSWDVIYQMPFEHDSIRGIADFLIKIDDGSGRIRYEPVDAKLARQEAKPGHVLQLCFYAEAITALTGLAPVNMHLWLGSGSQETLKVDEFVAYWRRLRAQLASVLSLPSGTTQTVPQPCIHCQFCDFAGECDAQWRSEDSLIYVAGLRTVERLTLEQEGVATLVALAEHDQPVPGLALERFTTVSSQARLQLEARQKPGDPPPYRLIPTGPGTTLGHGFEHMPEPDDGDVFLDFEGHPFWQPDQGLFFLFGLIERDDAGAWTYRTWWSHDPAEEQTHTAELISYLADRRARYSGMHVYHYNHTERSSLQRIAAKHGAEEDVLARLVETGAFIDLLIVARNTVQVGTESYSLKSLEQLTGYQRGHDIDQGAAAILEYEKYLAGDADALARIANYNEDDVRATRALRDWLLEHRPAELPWRSAELQADENPELDAQVAALHAHGPDTWEHLLGDVLGYWRREWRAHLAPLLARCNAEHNDLLNDPEVVTGLTCLGPMERTGKTGKTLTPVMRFALPAQDIGRV